MKSTGYPLHSPVSPSLPLPCVTVCHHFSTGLYKSKGLALHQTEPFVGHNITEPRAYKFSPCIGSSLLGGIPGVGCCSGKHIGPIINGQFLGYLILDNGTDTLYQNVGNQVPTNAYAISHQSWDLKHTVAEALPSPRWDNSRIKGETSEVTLIRHTEGRDTSQRHKLCQEVQKLKLIVLKEC